MAVYHGNDVLLEVASVDLSDHVTAVELVEDYGDLDTTAMGDSHETRIAGLGSFVLNVTFQQDQAGSEVFQTLQPLNGTVATFKVRADNSDGVSTTNQDITGSVLVNSFSYVNGQVGELDTFTVAWPGSGSLTLATQ